MQRVAMPCRAANSLQKGASCTPSHSGTVEDGGVVRATVVSSSRSTESGLAKSDVEGISVGMSEGPAVGSCVGSTVGTAVGTAVGADVKGKAVGISVGGDVAGEVDGTVVGFELTGPAVGLTVGPVVGSCVGSTVGMEHSYIVPPADASITAFKVVAMSSHEPAVNKYPEMSQYT